MVTPVVLMKLFPMVTPDVLMVPDAEMVVPVMVAPVMVPFVLM